MGLPNAFASEGFASEGGNSVFPERAPLSLGDPDDNAPSDPTEVADFSAGPDDSSSPATSDEASPASGTSTRPRGPNGRFVKADIGAPPAAQLSNEPEEPEFGIADDPSANEPAQAAAAAQPAADLDDDFLAMAEADYGFSADDVRAMGRSAAERAMAVVDQRTAAYVLNQLEGGQQEQQPVAPAAPQFTQPLAAQQSLAPQQQPPAPLAAPAQPTEYQLLHLAPLEPLQRPTLNPDDFEPEAIAIFNQQFDVLEKQHVAMEQQQRVLDGVLHTVLAHHQHFNQITSQSQAETQARTERDFDTWIAELGPEWADIYGEGSTAELPDNSPQLNARMSLARQMKGLRFAPTLDGGQPLAISKALFGRAHGSLNSNKIQEKARKAVTAEVMHRRTQAVAPATGQRAKPLSGRNAALARSRAFDRKAYGSTPEYFPAEV